VSSSAARSLPSARYIHTPHGVMMRVRCALIFSLVKSGMALIPFHLLILAYRFVFGTKPPERSTPFRRFSVPYWFELLF
jgi:hypothetical protein